MVKLQSRLWFLFVLILLFAITFVRFYQSLKLGRVGSEPNYDDIVYFNDAARRVSDIRNSGFDEFFRNLVVNPPHSPLMTFIATFVIFFFNESSKAIYAFHAFLCALLIYLIPFSMGSYFKNKYSSYLGLLMVALPLSVGLFFNFRPDILYALFVVNFISFLVSRKVSYSVYLILPFGVLLFLTKPSFVAFTFFNTMLCALILLYKRDFVSLSKIKIYLSVFTSIVALSWYVPKGFPQIWDYVVTNTITSNSEIWVGNSYFLTLFGNVSAVSVLIGLPMLFMLIFLGIYSFFLREKIFIDKSSWIILGVVAVINAFIASISKISNPFFFLTTILVICIFAIKSFEHLLIQLDFSQREFQYFFMAIILALLLVQNKEWSIDSIKASPNINKMVSHEILVRDMENVNFLFAGALNPDTVRWYLGSESQVILSSDALSIRDGSSFDKIYSYLCNYDAVITRVNNVAGFPSDSMQEYINNKISNETNLCKWQNTQIDSYFIWSKAKLSS